MVEVINTARQRNGLAPLRVSKSLNRSSKRFSDRLMQSDVFGHADHVQAARRFEGLGEVLEKHSGRGFWIRRTVQLWMGSSGHRYILLNPSMRWIGAGATRGRFGGNSETIWTVQVARR